MPLSSQRPVNSQDVSANCFGLRIESHWLQVAIATSLSDGRYRLEFDQIECPSASGWLTVTTIDLLTEALATMADRYDMRRQKVAVSLDGDFCVTRVTMGTTEEVDAELAMQADRIPRYLQLGPGEKVTGGSRKRIANSVDYAVTGVVNRSLIQLIYNALRGSDLDIMWVEPALVSIARLVGRAQIGGDHPVMIADGMGTLWDVGIACSGRLLLDYRPAAATDEEAFRDAIDGHISRLKRFCHRHRGVVTGELNRLLICGAGQTANHAVELIGDSLGVTAEVLTVPQLPELYEIDEKDRHSHSVPAVATVLPLLTDVSDSDVPDLLDEVRRAPELPWATRVVHTCWPVAASLLIMAIAFGLLSNQRRQRAGNVEGRAEIQAQIAATEIKFAELTRDRELLSCLTRIEQLTREPEWDRLLGRITQALPDSSKLNEFQVEPDGQILLDGTVLEESIVYELIQSLRRMPGIAQVALQGTTPETSGQGTRFVVRLTTNQSSVAMTFGAQNE